jgi:hypothetical protein
MQKSKFTTMFNHELHVQLELALQLQLTEADMPAIDYYVEQQQQNFSQMFFKPIQLTENELDTVTTRLQKQKIAARQEELQLPNLDNKITWRHVTSDKLREKIERQVITPQYLTINNTPMEFIDFGQLKGKKDRPEYLYMSKLSFKN